MNTQRPWSNQFYGTATLTCGVAALILLSACSGSNSDGDGSPISRPAESAAALANDATTSLSFAQAVAAGVADPADAPMAEAAVADSKPQGALQSSSVSVAQAQAGELTTSDTVQPQTEQASSEQTTQLPSGGDALTVFEESQIIEAEPIEVAEPIQVAEPVETTVPEAAQANGTANQTFTSQTSNGFAGELFDDGTVRVTWEKDPTARGYNVYRQAQYIETIFGEEWIQSDLYDESYYYEIQAFDAADNLYYVARGLTVDVTGTGRTNPDQKTSNEGLLDDYEMVFSDEFNGDSLDTTKWNTSYLWGSDLVINSEEQHYVDTKNQPDFGYSPFTFDGENLTINSIKTPASLLEKANGQPYLSGVITSYDSFKFTYGYVETRAKMPFGKGYWPAFWLLNAYYVDDKPEIDIMEFIGDDQDVVYHTYHYYDSDGILRSTHSEPTVGVDFTSDFHVFGVEWTPGTIVFYVDGVEQHRVSDPKVSQQDMYIIANTAIGGWWPGSPDEQTKFPGEYQIDYIRAYQRITPFEDYPFFDYVTKVPFADDTPGSSPNHLPPFELWPEGYPERQP